VKYIVDFQIVTTLSDGSIEVEAVSPEEAVRKVKEAVDGESVITLPLLESLTSNFDTEVDAWLSEEQGPEDAE
jgi:hypothetical protein